MRIGIVSDTHGSVSAWEKVISSVFKEAELIIHAGDVLYHGPRNPLPESYNPQKLAAAINASQVPIVFSRGNCDAEIDQMLIKWPLQSPYAFLQIESLRFLICHGHQLSPEEMEAQATRYGVKVFVYGHSHVPEIREKNNVIFLNPGSPSLSKDPQGKQTVALLDDNRLCLIDIGNMEIIQEVQVRR
ncbi:MAG: phosphodiesterase [Thermacetogeniaceae bacterium]